MMKQIISHQDCASCVDPCCRFHKSMTEFAPLFSAEEYARIAARTKDTSMFKKINDKTYTVHLVKGKEKFLTCPFLKDEKFCGIYDIAPFDCKVWPFGLMKDGKKVFLVVDLEEYCPGLERNMKLNAIKGYIGYLAKHFQSPAKKAMLKKYPSMILDYSNALTKLLEIKAD